ncbi:Sugar transporter domain containing protein [Hyaloscypha variabilis]
MKKYLGLRGKGLHNAIATLAGIGFILFGYDQGVMSGLLTLPTFVNTFPHRVVVAIYEIGCMFGALSTLWAGDKFGRRRTVFGGAIIMCIGAAIQCSAFALSQFVVGRIITGIANGFVTATVPMWQSECARAERRGPMVMVEGALIIFGLALAYWVDFAFCFVDGQINWRFPIAFQCVFAGTLIAFILELPESPRWLIKKGRPEDTKAVFAALDAIAVDDPYIQMQVVEISNTLTEEAGLRGSLKTMCTNGKKQHFHRSMLAIWSQAMQQLSGTNLITYYATSIYEESIGLSAVNARVVGACQNTAYLFVACIAIFTIERIGRRKLLLIGSVSQASSMAILAGTVHLANQGNSHAGIAAALFILFFNAFFVSFNSIGVYTYVIFAAFNLLMFFVVLFLYPETSHRSLEEIDNIFVDSNPWTPWDVVGIARRLPIKHPSLDAPNTLSKAEDGSGSIGVERSEKIELGFHKE